jgi:hypothetical protein
MLKATADGETNPAALAALADRKLRPTAEQLCNALSACAGLKPEHRRLLKTALERLRFLVDSAPMPKSPLKRCCRGSDSDVSSPAAVCSMSVIFLSFFLIFI